MADQDFDDFADADGSDGYVETFTAQVDNADAGGDQFFGEDDGDFATGAAEEAVAAPDFNAGAAPPAADNADESKGNEELDRRMEWRRAYNERLDAKRKASENAIRKRKEDAAKAISDYYERKETTREAKLTAGRSSEQEVIARLDEVASGNTWDRVLSLIDIKTDDPALNKTEAARFKTVLVQLKNEPVAASAE